MVTRQISASENQKFQSQLTDYTETQRQDSTIHGKRGHISKNGTHSTKHWSLRKTMQFYNKILRQIIHLVSGAWI